MDSSLAKKPIQGPIKSWDELQLWLVEQGKLEPQQVNLHGSDAKKSGEKKSVQRVAKITRPSKKKARPKTDLEKRRKKADQLKNKKKVTKEMLEKFQEEGGDPYELTGGRKSRKRRKKRKTKRKRRKSRKTRKGGKKRKRRRTRRKR